MADIVIQGIEMPKSGYIEILLKVNDGKIYYNYAGDKEIKSADFIPLLEGHGRLIDADTLRPDMVEYIAGNFRVCGYSRQKIDNADTVVSAEGVKE